MLHRQYPALQMVPAQHSKFPAQSCPAIRHAPQVPLRQTAGAQQGVEVPHDAPVSTQLGRSQTPLLQRSPGSQLTPSQHDAPTSPQRPGRHTPPPQ